MKKRNIIGIFDMDTATVSVETRRFLTRKERDGSVREESADIPKSFLLCEEGEKTSVILCKLSPTVLLGRAQGEGYAPFEDETDEEKA